MGKQGWNVNQAREIPGVCSIEFDDNSSMFTIRAEVSVCICTHTYMHIVYVECCFSLTIVNTFNIDGWIDVDR